MRGLSRARAPRSQSRISLECWARSGLREAGSASTGSSSSSGMLRMFCRERTRSSAAEDVMQTVFLRMLKRDAGAEAVGNMASFLHRSAVNAALDLVRSRQNIRNIPLDELEPVLAEPASRSPERAQHSNEIRDWLRGALARLNPRIAQMFALRFF